MRHAYLAALDATGCAVPETGWTPLFVTLQAPGDAAAAQLLAAEPFYVKTHSRGEYVFDWAWADAYERHGLPYYPKGLVAVPFTPVPGTRLLARSAHWRGRLVDALLALCGELRLSSLHVLFESGADRAACGDRGLLERLTVQFHWHNAAPPLADFEAYLATLAHDKRKKIRQERRRVAAAGVRFTVRAGREIAAGDWDHFYRCYATTYAEHGNRPYLTRDFFRTVAEAHPEDWLLFTAWQDAPGGAERVAASLVAVDAARGHAWGRYWGATHHIDCLHFCACYYEPLAWCIAHGYRVFEGRAQGEHKLARGLMPVQTHSAHWLAEPAFAEAVERYLAQEGRAVDDHVELLEAHAPFRQRP